MREICERPSLSEVNIILEPSGDQDGSYSDESLSVSRVMGSTIISGTYGSSSKALDCLTLADLGSLPVRLWAINMDSDSVYGSYITLSPHWIPNAFASLFIG